MTLRAGFNGTVGQSSAQVIDGSLKFGRGVKTYVTRTPASAGNQNTWTWSVWVKRSGYFGSRQAIFGNVLANATTGFACEFDTSNRLDVFNINSSGTYNGRRTSTRRFRDIGWYHIVIVVDTSLSIGDKIKVYVNGDQITDFDVQTNLQAAVTPDFNTTNSLSIGRSGSYNALYSDNHQSQVYFIDGQALGPGYFGFTDPLTNTWRPKKFRAEGTTVNDGTQWSSLVDVSNATVNNGSASNLFDGDTTTKINITSGYIEIDLSSRNVQAGPEGIEVYNNEAGVYTSYQVNGGETINWQGSPGWMSMGGVNSKINTIRINYITGGGVNAAFAFRVNGVTMVDSTTTNLAFGTNGFYLSMDGNSPIGQDKSGNGNDFTPSNFGGSVAFDSSAVSGARPILNTTQGGTQAGVGVFGSKEGFYETVSSSSGGGNPYIFDGRGTQPTLSFIRGATYVFDYSSATSHPLRFSTTSDGTHGGGSEYTDGTTTSGNIHKITVPHNAPDTLYYYCTNHSGMGNSISVTTDETKADPYAWKNVLALPLVGGVNDVSNQINSGSTTKNVASNGNATASSETSNLYVGSFKLDGSGDYITVTDSTELEPGTDDFCYEGWFRGANFTGTAYILFDSTQGTGVYFYTTSRKLYLYLGSGQVASTDCLANDKWHHIAFVRESGTGKIFCDGVLVGSGSKSDSVAGGNLVIGASTGGGNPLNGYVQDVRVYNGTPKYFGTTVGTQYFVPPSISPDILPDTPSGVSGSSKLTKITDGAVSFDGSSDYLSVPNSSDFLFGTGDFTVECFAYFNNATSGQSTIVGMWGLETSQASWLLYRASGNLMWYTSTNGSSQTASINAAHNMASKSWNHIAYVRNSGTTTIYVNGKSIGSTSSSINLYDANCSLVSGYNPIGGTPDYMDGFISNLHVVKGTALYTSNFTPPSSPLTDVTNTKLLCCHSNTSANLAAVSPATFSNSGDVYSSGISGSQDNTNGGGSAAAFDGQLGNEDGYGSYPNAGQTLTWTAANSDLGTTLAYSSTIRVYVNVDANGDAGGLTVVGNNGSQTISAGSAGGRWVDISAATSPITSIAWPRASSGSQGITLVAVEVDGSLLIDGLYGEAIQRFYDAGATNLNPFNTDINTVRGQENSYPTWNPLRVSGQALSNNSMTATGNSGNVLGSMFTPTSGKFYWEVTAGSDYTMTGIQRENNYDMSFPGNSTGQICLYLNAGMGGGQLYNAGSITSSWGGGVTGDVIGVALDMDNNKVYFYNNGRGLGSGGITGTPEAVDVPTGGGYTANCRSGSGTSDGPSTINFGQTPFKFPPPDGFQPLNTANKRPETVIARPDQYVDLTTYTGTGATRRMNIGLQPDLVWIKQRNTTVEHQLFDSVRGPGKRIQSDTTNNEYSASNLLSSFNSDGFTLESSNFVNGTTSGPRNYVAWSWKAGGNKNTFNVDDVGYATAAEAGITGLDGTNQMTTAKYLGCSIGTKQGFSIIKYNGLGGSNDVAIPHGLSQAPDMVMVKNLTDSIDWAVAHSGFVDNRELHLNTNEASTSVAFLGLYKSNFTSTSFAVNYGTTNQNYVNASGKDYIAYVWHNVPGLQKFGSYNSNNSADGPYIELGFRPALVLIKCTSGAESWVIYDSKRGTYNYNGYYLQPNSNGTEPTSNTESLSIDMLSDGFKVRGTWGAINDSNLTDHYIYAAWAEAPASNLFGGQSNAR